MKGRVTGHALSRSKKTIFVNFYFQFLQTVKIQGHYLSNSKKEIPRAKKRKREGFSLSLDLTLILAYLLSVNLW